MKAAFESRSFLPERTFERSSNLRHEQTAKLPDIGHPHAHKVAASREVLPGRQDLHCCATRSGEDATPQPEGSRERRQGMTHWQPYFALPLIWSKTVSILSRAFNMAENPGSRAERTDDAMAFLHCSLTGLKEARGRNQTAEASTRRSYVSLGQRPRTRSNDNSQALKGRRYASRRRATA